MWPNYPFSLSPNPRTPQKLLVWVEKIGKNSKNSKNLEVAGRQLPYHLSHTSYSTFFMKIINFKKSDFWKLMSPCAISALHFATFNFSCKNEACVNCDTLNTTTLIWLLNSLQFWELSILLNWICRRTELKFSSFPFCQVYLTKRIHCLD